MVIISSSRASGCLPLVKKQNMTSIFVLSMKNKTIIRFGYCDIRNNKGLGKGYQPQPQPRLRLITLTETFIILDITKISSNNCLMFSIVVAYSHSLCTHVKDYVWKPCIRRFKWKLLLGVLSRDTVCWAVLLCGTVYFAVQGGCNFKVCR